MADGPAVPAPLARLAMRPETSAVRPDADEAVAALFREQALPMLRLALLLVGDRASAEDVVQDAFFGLHRAYDRLRDPDRALPYLRAAVVNGARSVLRARRRAAVRRVQHEPPAWSAESAAIASEEQRAVLVAVRSPSGRARARQARPRRSSRSRFTIVAVAVTGAAAMAFVVPQLLAATTITRPVHTAWQAFQRLPAGPVPGGQPRAAGSWRLAGYLTSTGWHGTIAGPPPGLLTCPTRSACYVTASTSTRPHAPLDSLYVTTDGTRRWSGVQLPGRLGFTSALSCVSATTCAAGAAENGQPLFASTTDGGHSWTLDPLPAGAAGITDLACPAAGTCVGLDAAGYQSPAQLQSGEAVLVTTDSGAHFSTSSFPAGDAMQQLACPTVRHCVATGVAGSSRASLLAGVAAVSSDGGATWHRGRVPAGFSPLWQVTCADAAHCWMLGLVGSKSPTSDVAASADGGLTWTREPMPRGAPGLALDGIACPTSTSCYASGGDSITENFGPRGSNGSSAVILVSQDGGGTWTRVTFAKPARIPAGMQIDAFMSAGQIQCPQAGACVSLGVSDQGSASTPVYTTGGF